MSGIHVFTDENYTGLSHFFLHPADWRYCRVGKFPSPFLNNTISSLNYYTTEERATAILFERQNFKGRFVAFYNSSDYSRAIPELNSRNFNNMAQSILLVTHADSENMPLNLGLLGRSDVIAAIDEQLNSVPEVSRRGDPTFTWEMWPVFDPDKKFVKLRIPLRIHVPYWSDYDASITYLIYFYIDIEGRLGGYVNHVTTWVESGILSRSISNRLHPAAIDSVDAVNAQILEFCTEFESYRWESLYYMPGRAPLALPDDYSGSVTDDVTMILIRKKIEVAGIKPIPMEVAP